MNDENVPLAGVPDGLAARALRRTRPGPDGQRVEVRTRRGQRKTDEVLLVAAGTPVAVSLDESEERWLLGAGRRRWASVVARYGHEAWPRAVQLARGGVVAVRCGVDERMALGDPHAIVLTDQWQVRRARRDEDRAREHDAVGAAALGAAQEVAGRCPQLADALRASSPSSPLTAVLVHAARDLLDGVVHAGPRAFSQAHFEHGKARDDVAGVLRGAGVPGWVLDALGLTRSARLGVGGPVAAVLDGAIVNVGALRGPVLLRADQPGLRLRSADGAVLVIVENLQAAETVADQFPQLALVYTAGPPGPVALRLIAGLAADCARVLLIPDADLGGVRIAEAVLRAVPGARLLDVGAQPHPVRERWPVEGVSARGLRAAALGSAGSLARACLARGYPVEQELATVAALRDALADSG